METMLANMLAKAIPEELRHHLTPEGMANVGKQAGSVLEFFKAGIILNNQKADAILLNQKEIMEALNVGSAFNPGPSVKRSDTNSIAA